MCSCPQALHFSAIVKCQVLWYGVHKNRPVGQKRADFYQCCFLPFIWKRRTGLGGLAEGSERKAENRCARVCMFAWVRAEALTWVCAGPFQRGNMMFSGKAPQETEEPAWALHSARTVSAESTRQARSSAQQQHLPGQINLVEPHVCLPCPFNTVCTDRGKAASLASSRWHAVVGRARPFCSQQKGVPRSQLSGWEPLSDNRLNFFTINVCPICQSAALKSSFLSLSLFRGKQSESSVGRLVCWNLAISLCYSLIRQVRVFMHFTWTF